MSGCSEPPRARRLKYFAAFASLFSAIVGALALVGWGFHVGFLKNWAAGPSTVKINTAICFLLIGASLWLQRNADDRLVASKNLAARIAAVAAVLLGLVSAAEYAFNASLGIDTWWLAALAAGEAGRAGQQLMSTVTSLDFVLLGLALAFLNQRTQRGRWPAQFLSLAAVATAIFGILTFIAAPRIAPTYISLSVPTGVTLIVVSFGVVCARQEWGVGAVLVSQSLGGTLLRQLSLPAICIPLLIAFVLWKISATGLLSEWGTAVLTTAMSIFLLAGLTAQAAVVIERHDIERRKAEEVREHLAAVVDSSDDAIISKSLDGVIKAWNRGAENVFGYSSSEAVGKPMLMLFPSNHEEEEGDILARIRRGESVEHFETIRIRKGGERIDVSVTISPIRDGSGMVVGASTIARDITGRKRAEEALRDQAQMLDLAQVLVRDTQGRIVLWNQGAENLYGFGKQEAVGRVSHELLQTEFPEPLAQIEEKLRRSGSWEGELVHLKRDQTRIVVSSLWVLHRDAQGNPHRVLEANVDVTGRKEAERQLAAQSEELSLQSKELLSSREALETQTLMLQSVLDSMEEGLVAADERGKFILWNPAATRIVGIGADNVPPGEWNTHYGVYLPDTITPLPNEQNPLSRALRGEVSTAEMFLRNPELEEGVWIEISGGPLKGKDGATRGGVVAFRDITQRKIDEREIHKLNEELEERVAQRTAQLEAANHELEAFTYSVSHDLRAPLRHIGGFSKILTEDFGPGLPPEAQTHLQRIEDGVHRMGLLVDELLNLARVGRHALQLQSTRLNSVIEEVVSLLQPEIVGRAVTWKIAELPSAECDPILIKQVFQNLIANALKFTRTRERAVIEISRQQEDGDTVIAIGDNGVGFNMKYKDKLFGVFQRLHRAEDFEGTGIGLATVKRIIHKHGGEVWAKAELDKGATFYFTLSAASAKLTLVQTDAAGA